MQETLCPFCPLFVTFSYLMILNTPLLITQPLNFYHQYSFGGRSSSRQKLHIKKKLKVLNVVKTKPHAHRVKHKIEICTHDIHLKMCFYMQNCPLLMQKSILKLECFTLFSNLHCLVRPHYILLISKQWQKTYTVWLLNILILQNLWFGFIPIIFVVAIQNGTCTHKEAVYDIRLLFGDAILLVQLFRRLNL